MSRLRIGLAVVAVLCVACRSDEIELVYRFHVGTTTEYLMSANARAQWDIGGGGRGTSSLEIRVRETVERVDDSGATLEVTMFPQEATGAGLLAPGAERRSFKLRVGPNGAVLEVLEINGVPARVLRPEERTLIGTFRVPLPPSSVGLFDSWAAPLGVGSEVGLGGSEIRGELERLDTDGERQNAHLSYSGRGPLSWTVSLPQGEAALSGEAVTDMSAVFDIAGGWLTMARSTTRGTFDLRVERGRAQAPISGSLSFVLDLEVVRAGPV